MGSSSRLLPQGLSEHSTRHTGRVRSLCAEPPRSIHDRAAEEANRYKWIESEKQGRDLGAQAVDDWYERHFSRLCRYLRLQHITGAEHYVEFGEAAFGRLMEILTMPDPLVEAVLDRVEAGWENLDLVVWAQDWNLPIDRVIELLALIDVNCARLEPQRTECA